MAKSDGTKKLKIYSKYMYEYVYTYNIYKKYKNIQYIIYDFGTL